MAQQSQQAAQTDPKRMAKAALQAFFSITGRWDLCAAQQRILLGEPAESTFYAWKREQSANRLSRDTLDRISYIMGIHKALNILLPSSHAANSWVKKPNTATLFAGDTALNRMLGGGVEDLAAVRRYLDAQRG